MAEPGAPLLTVRGLRVSFGRGPVASIAVDGLDLDVRRGEVLGVVGESGSGKSVSMLAAMGLVDAPGRVSADALSFDGIDLLGLSPRDRRRRVGRRMSMIFQDPVASLDPCWTVGDQLVEVLAAQRPAPRAALRERALALMRAVEIPDPESRLRAWPHQLSGGMCQRVMIALALAGEPELLVADEPTTALDVTIQAQVVELLRRLQAERGMAMVLISHDLALVSGIADRVVVMYAGQAMETGTPERLFASPRHPYTRALLAALPEANRGRSRLLALPGTVPARDARPAGCPLAPRCPVAEAACAGERPAPRAFPDGGTVACRLARSDPGPAGIGRAEP
jgi:dipeptide transport system ATP-binding protein